MPQGDSGPTRETEEYSVSLPSTFVEETLMPAVPAASRPPEAIRLAVHSDVERREEVLTPGAIKTSIIEALQETGDEIKSTQRVVIKNAEDIDIEEAEDVDIAEVADE
jgi:hypothetical protein